MYSLQEQLNSLRNNGRPMNPQQMPPQMNQSIQQIKNMMSMVQMSANPQIALQNIVNQNPNLQNILNLANSNGANLQQVFYNMAKQKGVNPEDVINALRS